MSDHTPSLWNSCAVPVLLRTGEYSVALTAGIPGTDAPIVAHAFGRTPREALVNAERIRLVNAHDTMLSLLREWATDGSDFHCDEKHRCLEGPPKCVACRTRELLSELAPATETPLKPPRPAESTPENPRPRV